ncbi:amino acid kinase family protein [Alienimonas californiensis]|uniref:Amino acid kinase family protein n=1 Tax=Alienimonas californiensis TaxID=2527989 RepID=A0A517P881_9PLAN|nr:hypothetical protein [Alienimonas californiensis]QDT15577.1 Amino acid kinase family protein [Alienimonas californiensis]
MHASAAPLVVKLGGSLLDLPDLAGRLGEVLRNEPRALVVVGGGAAADAVRDWDRSHRLGEERAHRLACEALGLTARFVSELLPGAERVSTRDAARDAWGRGATAVLDLPRFLEREEPLDGHAPPHTWDTTSDTLAAWVARRWPARRLALLKSCERRPDAVDAHFAQFAAGLEVEWVNLRALSASGGRQPAVSSKRFERADGVEHTEG